MYQAFYGLRELPFELTPNPKFLFLSAAASGGVQHSAVRAVSAPKAVTVLIGEAGTGKTTLLRRHFRAKRADT